MLQTVQRPHFLRKALKQGTCSLQFANKKF
jgi:hypothetical protein